MMISRVKKQMSGRGGAMSYIQAKTRNVSFHLNAYRGRLIVESAIVVRRSRRICCGRSSFVHSRAAQTAGALRTRNSHTHTHTHTQSLYLFIICIVLARGVRSQKTFWTLNLTSPLRRRQIASPYDISSLVATLSESFIVTR